LIRVCDFSTLPPEDIILSFPDEDELDEETPRLICYKEGIELTLRQGEKKMWECREVDDEERASGKICSDREEKT
jgi:hypothetical protein